MKLFPMVYRLSKLSRSLKTKSEKLPQPGEAKGDMTSKYDTGY